LSFVPPVGRVEGAKASVLNQPKDREGVRPGGLLCQGGWDEAGPLDDGLRVGGKVHQAVGYGL